MWNVKVVIDGNPFMMPLCCCQSPEALTAVIGALAKAKMRMPVQIEYEEPPPEPQRDSSVPL